MLGKLIGSAIKITTLPIDIASLGLDILSGSDGSKQSRNEIPNPINIAERIRDEVAETIEDLDED